MYRRLPTRFVHAAFTALIVTVIGVTAWADVSVKGYTRRDGTYVRPHMRSNPDGNFGNNWSTVGNRNPYTGQWGTKRTPPSGYGGRRSTYAANFYGSSESRSDGSESAFGEPEAMPKQREYKQYKRPDYVANHFTDEQKAEHSQLVIQLQDQVQGLTWQRYTPERLEEIQERIEAANRIKQLGISVEWYHFSIDGLLRLETALAAVAPSERENLFARMR